MIKNEGSSYANNSYNATSFYTNEGEKVYVTAGFLYLLQSIFKVREDALDVAIQRFTIKPPAPKEIEQGKINIRKPYKSEKDMMEELGKFKKAVTDICFRINTLHKNQIPTIAKIKNDALSSSGLTARQVDRYIKVSTILIKTELETETTTGHIRQIVRQFFKGNNLILRQLKINV